MKKKSVKIQKQKPLHVIWAVSGFEDRVRLARSGSVAFIRKLSKQRPLTIEPVFVLSLEELNIWSDTAFSLLDQFENSALKHLKQSLGSVPELSAVKPTILRRDLSTKRSSAQVLGDYAAKSGASLILCDTHARSGVSRLVLGSFTESLLLVSKVPVLACNPGAKFGGPLNSMSFVTDFSKESKTAFQKTIKLAKVLGINNMDVVHAVPLPFEPVLQSGAALLGAGWVSADAYFTDGAKQARAKASAYCGLARKAGLTPRGIILEAVPSVTAGVLAHAKRWKPGLVACTAQSSKVRAALLGSICRNLVRELACPVLVTRP